MHKPGSIFEAASSILFSEANQKQYTVQVEYGPHMAETINVKAKDEDTAKKKALALFVKANPGTRGKHAYASSASLAESKITEAVELSDEDLNVINTVKKAFPGGSKISKWNGSLEWEKSGGYAGEKSLKTAREKLEKMGFKYNDGKLLGLPDGSTSGFNTILANKKLGWYVTIIQFYGQTASRNRYSITLKKLPKKNLSEGLLSALKNFGKQSGEKLFDGAVAQLKLALDSNSVSFVKIEIEKLPYMKQRDLIDAIKNWLSRNKKNDPALAAKLEQLLQFLN